MALAPRFKLDENLPHLDFADIRLYPPASTPGVWVMRPHLQSVPVIVSLLRRALKLLETEPTEHTLWVIDDHRVRIRG